MPIDASIYQMIQQPKPQPGPMDRYIQGLQVGQLLDASALGKLQRQQLEGQIAREPAAEALRAKLGALDIEGKQAGIAKTRTETIAAQAKIARDMLAGVKDQQTFDAWKAHGISQGWQSAASAPAVYDPQWQQQQIMTADAFLERAAPKPPAGHRVMPNGQLSPIDPEYLKGQTSIAEAKRPITNVNVSTEKKYGEQFAANIAKQDADMLDAARKAPDLATRANQVLETLGGGKVITGAGADIRLQLGKALNLAGASDAEVIANTEVLATDLARNTLDAIKASGLGSGTGFSNADRDFLEKAVGGKITLEGTSIKRLAELAHRAAEKTAMKWGERARQIPKDAIQGTGISTEPPQVPAMWKPKAPAFTQDQIDAELRRRGVIR